MASKTLLLAIMVALIAAPAFATDYVVGDAAGWKLLYNYAAWAQTKTFVVGDTILFKYNPAYHNVFKVNETAYHKCLKPPPSEALTSGNDKITLDTPGKKWFICGVNTNCLLGQKLEITVST